MKRTLIFAALIVGGCGDAGATVDGGSHADLGARDLGPGADLGPRADLGPGSDAGPLPDLGPLADGGTGRPFPDTTARIAIFADQLPGSMTTAEQTFAVTHYVGTQKLTLAQSMPLRAMNPAFLVLHYHLAMWQSAPGVDFIIDGHNWGNDFPMVTTHEPWFWHSTSAMRVPSTADGKLLMDIADPDFRDYWATSIAAQTTAGDYDGVFLDSASPALLQGETTADARLAGTGVKDGSFPELGGTSWIAGWNDWIGDLDARFAARGIPLIPNTGAFITSWDTSDYGRTAGIFSEGFAGTSFAPSDWRASESEISAIARAGKIVILQNYLGATSDVATRLFYLGSYLLVKETHTYLFYFASSTLEWYPEWDLDLGAPMTSITSNIDDLLVGGVYRRDFAHGIVLVNPSDAVVTATLGATFHEVVPTGGGAIDTPGANTMTDVSTLDVPAHGAAVLLR